MALFLHVTMDDRLAAAGQQHPCMDRSGQLNAYAALTGGLDLARSVHYLALSARLIEQAPAASEQDKLEPWLHPHALMHGYFPESRRRDRARAHSPTGPSCCLPFRCTWTICNANACSG
ncbi:MULTISPECIES: hypothetical protein [Stenotrophomonas]|uniref:hypothetical protein n=1 Tax=Stenotrophomonas TaxID=40323 RepID=UPI001EF95C2A|nr:MULTISPECIES: hypothetical protein [Stenotrophomonas]MDQ7290089.1 hypothetical protein [Stenotrophomonas sp. Sm2128]MDT3473719.1 hypothetical protein [Stenotrophomonas maltophilia]